jgi:hypothetical protein
VKVLGLKSDKNYTWELIFRKQHNEMSLNVITCTKKVIVVSLITL